MESPLPNWLARSFRSFWYTSEDELIQSVNEMENLGAHGKSHIAKYSRSELKTITKATKSARFDRVEYLDIRTQKPWRGFECELARTREESAQIGKV